MVVHIWCLLVYQTHAVPTEAKEGLSLMKVLGIKPGISAKATGAIDCCPISLSQEYSLFCIIFVLCKCRRGHLCITGHMWRAEDIQESALSSHHVGPGHQTQVIRFGLAVKNKRYELVLLSPELIFNIV